MVAVPAAPKWAARSPSGANRHLRAIAVPMVFSTVTRERHANDSLPIQEKNHVETRGRVTETKRSKKALCSGYPALRFARSSTVAIPALPKGNVQGISTHPEREWNDEGDIDVRCHKHRRTMAFFRRRWTGIQEFLPDTSGTTAPRRGNTTWHGAGIVSTRPSPGTPGGIPQRRLACSGRYQRLPFARMVVAGTRTGGRGCTTTPFTKGGFTHVSLLFRKGWHARCTFTRLRYNKVVAWKQAIAAEPATFLHGAWQVGAHSCRG